MPKTRNARALLRFFLLAGWPFLAHGLSGQEEPVSGMPPLTFVPLKPTVPCGDGSPAGVYESRTTNSNNHVLLVEGGGFCDSDESCQDKLRTRFYRLSSTVFPQEAKGSQIMSDNEIENPTMFNYNKWLVPYCSQDLFLGAGTGRVGGLVRAGSLHMLAVIEHIRNSTQQIDQLVIVGVSAGTMGVANHMIQFREMAQELGVQNLKVILDSSMFYDQSEHNNYDSFSSLYIDHAVHPLCNIEDYPINPDVSTLPCCSSIHCHIQNGLFQSAITTINNSTGTSLNESFLLLDSGYDPLMAMEMVYGTFDSSDNNDGGKYTESQLLFELGEFAGSRLHAVSDSLFSNSHLQASSDSATSVIWAIPSCLAHPFLTTSSLETSFLKLRMENPGEFSKYSDDGTLSVTVGIILDDDSSTKIGVSNSVHKWEDATVGEHTIRNLIEGFVNPGMVALNPPLVFPSSGTIILSDNCSGPNCVPVGKTDTNTCQEYVVVESLFVGVPPGFRTFLAVLVGLFIVSFFLRYRPISFFAGYLREPQGKVHTPTAAPARIRHGSILGDIEASLPASVEQTVGIKIDSLSVYTKSGDPILVDVNFELQPGTVNGLLGRSGSGKSTLLGACCGQMRPGMVLATQSDIKVSMDSTTYLRQHDNVSLENLTPSSYLNSCAEIYGTDHSVLREMRDFVRPFFHKRASTDEEEGEEEDHLAEPFETTQIKSCSGGQRRVLAVAAALLTGPTILLLDEPLSGLDSAASETLMAFLQGIASQKDLTILVTMHQPSDDILGYLDELIIMQDGRKIFNERFDTVTRALELEGEGRRISDCIHEIVKIGEVRDNLKRNLDHSRNARRSCVHRRTRRSSGASYGHGRKSLSCRCSLVSKENIVSPHALSQVFALSRRLRLEYGNNWTDLYILPVCFVITSLVVNMRERSPFQISLAVMLFIYLPVLIFQHHNPLALKMWNAHRTELDDRRISCASYYVSTLTFTMSMPLLSILISYPMAFAILGWEFSPFLDVYLFAVFFLLVVFELARCLLLIFRGSLVYWKIFLLILFFNIIFAGILASPATAPDGVRWIFALDFSFWALSGSVLTIFEKLDSLTEGTCLSFLNCIVSDGSFVAGQSGFGTLSTPSRAMTVVVGIFVFFAISEFLLLRNRRTHFVDPSSVVSSPAKLLKKEAGKHLCTSMHTAESVAIESEAGRDGKSDAISFQDSISQVSESVQSDTSDTFDATRTVDLSNELLKGATPEDTLEMASSSGASGDFPPRGQTLNTEENDDPVRVVGGTHSS